LDTPGPQDRDWWGSIAGFSPYSGTDIPDEVWRSALRRAERALSEADWDRAVSLAARPRTTVCERIERAATRARAGAHHARAVLFGYGNYAKSIMLPNLPPAIAVETVHELDPAQAPIRPVHHPRLHTRPAPPPDDHYEVSR